MHKRVDAFIGRKILEESVKPTAIRRLFKQKVCSACRSKCTRSVVIASW